MYIFKNNLKLVVLSFVLARWYTLSLYIENTVFTYLSCIPLPVLFSTKAIAIRMKVFFLKLFTQAKQAMLKEDISARVSELL